MMTLDEAIKHAEEVATKMECEAMCVEEAYQTAKQADCEKCAEEHWQLAEWLKELKQLREQTRWIPVSEGLPEDEVEVLIYTTDNKINKAYRRHKSWKENQMEWLVFETLGYGYIYDDDEVLAWMPKPKPYKAKSEDQTGKENCNTCIHYKSGNPYCESCFDLDKYERKDK